MTEDEFQFQINQRLLPSSPIRRQELLQGRSEQLQQVRRALASPGRSVFIHGERGVGKSSVAQTAAYLHQSPDNEPLILACDQTTDIFSISYEIATRTVDNAYTTTRKGFSAGMRYLSYEHEQIISRGEIPRPKTINEAISLIKFSCACHSEKPTFVIDEFDRITNENARKLFGDLIKQLGDQEVHGSFIFCGVGASIENLLASHDSCFRYISSIELERLGFDPRMDIISYAATAVDITVDKTYLVRISHISDGFPHYIHLITSEVFWSLFEAGHVPGDVTSESFSEGCKRAVKHVEASLKSKYRRATEKYQGTNDYEYILWAVSDHPDLRRPSAKIFDSYLEIVAQTEDIPISRSAFNNRMSALKSDRCGNILSGTRQGWYRFSEPVIRGYCRLQAQLSGVKLDKEHYLAI